MSKQDVKIWQRVLRDAGAYLGPIDGSFDAGSRRASFEVANIKETVEPRLFANLTMINQKATRNKPITANLRAKLAASIVEVYGPTATIAVYSGGQDRKGKGTRRTGSVRHDDYGEGGRAADCYIYIAGRKIFGIELAKLGRYWLAMGYGGVGLEMATGGIHLDEWATPPKGGGLFWTYKYSDRKPWGASVKAMLQAGVRGEFT